MLSLRLFIDSILFFRGGHCKDLTIFINLEVESWDCNSFDVEERAPILLRVSLAQCGYGLLTVNLKLLKVFKFSYACGYRKPFTALNFPLIYFLIGSLSFSSDNRLFLVVLSNLLWLVISDCNIVCVEISHDWVHDQENRGAGRVQKEQIEGLLRKVIHRRLECIFDDGRFRRDRLLFLRPLNSLIVIFIVLSLRWWCFFDQILVLLHHHPHLCDLRWHLRHRCILNERRLGSAGLHSAIREIFKAILIYTMISLLSSVDLVNLLIIVIYLIEIFCISYLWFISINWT